MCSILPTPNNSELAETNTNISTNFDEVLLSSKVTIEVEKLESRRCTYEFIQNFHLQVFRQKLVIVIEGHMVHIRGEYLPLSKKKNRNNDSNTLLSRKPLLTK